MADYVTAVPDGWLAFISNKASNPKDLGIWSRQNAALLFEVRFQVYFETNNQSKKLQISSKKRTELGNNNIAASEKTMTAAQMFAEMLGIVCHTEFISLGEQMVRYYPTVLIDSL
jgi:hypothetical protein